MVRTENALKQTGISIGRRLAQNVLKEAGFGIKKSVEVFKRFLIQLYKMEQGL